MTAVCVQFPFNVPDGEFDDVFKLANDAVGEADIICCAMRFFRALNRFEIMTATM